MKEYSEKDFVEVFDENEESQGRVPKSWLGTDLLPDGVKPKSRGGRQSGQGQSDAERQAAEKAKADADAKAKAEAEQKAAAEKAKADAGDSNKGS